MGKESLADHMTENRKSKFKLTEVIDFFLYLIKEVMVFSFIL